MINIQPEQLKQMSETDKLKKQLEFYENELRKIEQMNSQQKHSYQKQIQDLESQIEQLQSPAHNHDPDQKQINDLESKVLELTTQLLEANLKLDPGNLSSLNIIIQNLATANTNIKSGTAFQVPLPDPDKETLFDVVLESLTNEIKDQFIEFIQSSHKNFELTQLPCILNAQLSYEVATSRAEIISQFQGCHVIVCKAGELRLPDAHIYLLELLQDSFQIMIQKMLQVAPHSSQMLQKLLSNLNPSFSQIQRQIYSLIDQLKSKSQLSKNLELNKTIQQELERSLEEKDSLLLEQESKLLNLTEELDQTRQQLQESNYNNRQLNQEFLSVTEQQNKTFAQLQKDLESFRQKLTEKIEIVKNLEHELLIEKEKYKRTNEGFNLTTDEIQRRCDQMEIDFENKLKEQQLEFQIKFDQQQEEYEYNLKQCQNNGQNADEILKQLDHQQNQNDLLKSNLQQVLKYKNDLEVVLEQSTHALEQKNRKLAIEVEKQKSKDALVEQAEANAKRAQQSTEENKRKVLNLEVKIKSHTQTVKDFKNKITERDAEIEVLKEMVKSSHVQSKAKDIDISRLNKRLIRLGERQTSALSGGRQQYDSPTYQKSPPRLQDVITERDEIFEQTYDTKRLPKMTKTKRQEWEEAVELDKMLENERREKSQQRLQQNTDKAYQDYLEKSSNPAQRHYSNGMGGVLGSSTGQVTNLNSLPDLIQSKREMYEKELFTENSPLKRRH